MRKLLFLVSTFCAFSAQAETEELIKFGDFEQWIQRDIKESALIGGARKSIFEIGPTAHWTEVKPYTNQGGSPWATSNVLAKVAGIVKTNASVYKDTHANGSCAKLVTHLESVKVLGMVNIEVLAAGSLFTGDMKEPLTSSKNPMSKMNFGIPINKSPKAIRFDYNVILSGKPDRIRQTGFSKVTKVSGIDMPEVVVILQKRTEDAQGNITAKRVGTMITRFGKSTNGWQNNKTFEINYGDITTKSWYRSYMGLVTGERTYYATNSKGKQVPINEDGWADADETPTHIIIKFDSSHGGAYIGSEGTTLMIDNVRLVY